MLCYFTARTLFYSLSTHLVTVSDLDQFLFYKHFLLLLLFQSHFQHTIRSSILPWSLLDSMILHCWACRWTHPYALQAPVSVWARGAPPVTHLDNSEGADRWGLCHQVLLRHQVVPPAPHETKGPPQSEVVEYRGGGGIGKGEGEVEASLVSYIT